MEKLGMTEGEGQLPIYKSLFPGRPDVYPEYYKTKKDKQGYSPKCKNRFKEDLCNYKCDGCPNQEFVPITDSVYKKHLAGQQLIGVYPLLPDNTCCFIAADFDDHTPDGSKNPFKDVKNFYEVCNVQEIPCYIERSKSGKGYHAWIFFDKNIPAWKARLVVIALLKEAQVVEVEVFPKQDELSRKCLGNLIALPLWGEAFKEGNSTFLDKNFKPINGTGIWEFLKNIKRVSESQLDRVIQEWNLQREEVKSHSKYGPPDKLGTREQLECVINHCKFIQHSRDEQIGLKEDLWYPMISNLSRFDGGREKIHEFSCQDPRYTKEETDKKIDHAFRNSGPMTCEEIKKRGFNCDQKCGVKAPAGLGVQSHLWEDPICFDAKIVPPAFPLEVLPGKVAQYVRSVAENRQVPVDLPAMLALGVINAVAAKKFKVKIGSTHSEPLNIYVVSALDPGTRKTDTFKDITIPLIREEQLLLEEIFPQIERAKTQREFEEARLKHLKNEAARAKDSTKRKQFEQEAIELGEKLTPIPCNPRLLAGADFTPETLTTYLYENKSRLAIIDAEGGGLFPMIAGRYAKESNLEVYLKGHSGDEIRVGRKGRPDEYIHEPALSIIVTVQPDVIKSLAGNAGFRSRGLLGRFLYSMPTSLVGERIYKDIAIDGKAQMNYMKLIKKIFDYPWNGDDSHALIISGEALKTWAAYADEVEKAQMEGGELYGIRDWASKLAGAVARIAGGLHLVQCQENEPWKRPISTETILAAWTIGFYLKAHALTAFDLMEANTEIGFARSIWKWIIKKQKTIITLSDYYRENRPKINKPEGLLPYFRILESRNFIRQMKDEKQSTGRKAKYLFELNPKCAECQKCIQDIPL